MAVTRADVARRAGVSPAVVSYVLNPGSRPVSAAARARIEAAIKELGYRPNAVAQALRRSSTMSIGVMVPDLTNVVDAALARAIEDIAYDLGYVLFVGSGANDPAREERYLRNYVDRQVDALILFGARDPRSVREIAGPTTPVIVLDRVTEGLGVSTVTPESRDSSRRIVEHLIEVHGHRLIACVSSEGGLRSLMNQRVLGWRDAMTAAGLPCDDRFLFTSRMPTRESGAAGALAMLDSVHPTAFFTTSDMQAIGLIGAIRGRDFLVPKDLAVVSYDNSELAERAFPGLTSVDAHSLTIAQLAMRRLTDALQSKSGGETHDVVETDIAYRRSCGCDVPFTSQT